MLIQVNTHLEKLLAKENRDKDMLHHMKTHCWARMHVCKAKMKILKRRLSKALKQWKKPDPLQILAEASFYRNNTLYRVFTPNLSKFGENFVILKFLSCKTVFLAQRVAHNARPIRLGGPNHKCLVGLDFSWWIIHFQLFPNHFIKFWVTKRLKSIMKLTFLPPFPTAGSTSGRIHFWEGKWDSHCKISHGLEIKHIGLSNKLSWAQFGCQEVPPK